MLDKSTMSRLTISIGDQTMARIAQEARRQSRSKAFVIRQIIKSHFQQAENANGK